MFNVDFLYGISKEEQRDKWKKSIRQVGEEVYSFFQDVAPDKGYAIREGQWDMACEITDAMRDKKHILVEAGVGTGKTFGYIVPLLYYHKIGVCETLNPYKYGIFLSKNQITPHWLWYNRVDKKL